LDITVVKNVLTNFGLVRFSFLSLKPVGNKTSSRQTSKTCYLAYI